MGANDSNTRRLSRREWLRLVGVGTLATAASVASPLPLSAQAIALQDDSPEAFLAKAYAQRAQAMTTKDVRLLDALYDTANPQLGAFEKERAIFFADLGSRWDGTVLKYDATASLLDLKVVGSTATIRLYETIRVLWIQNPVTFSPAELLERQREPERFVSDLVRGARGEITSIVGTRHEVTLQKHANGWRLVRDAYEEPDLFGASPDLVPGSWAAVWFGKMPNSQLKVDAPPPTSTDVFSMNESPNSDVGINGLFYYYGSDAKAYAQTYCSSYNTAYCNYNACGGDCANFVSQCLRRGNQGTDSQWYTFSGACGNCGTTSSRAGTDTWANNKYLRDWAINKGRAVAKSSISDLRAGDTVNYDWTGNGSYDHITLVVAPKTTSGDALICSHNADRCNTPWQMGGASRYLYTYFLSQYQA